MDIFSELDYSILSSERMKEMLMESKTKQKTASSAINGGRKIIDSGVEVVKNKESLDHFDFLEEIEAPMWADLSLCDLTNDEIDDSWFDICHPFHQCSSSQLISTSSISIHDPPSPKLPPSVSKSRGKSYKTNKQQPVKTLTKKSSESTESINKSKPISKAIKLKENEGLNACSSCESGPTDTSRSKFSNSRSTLTFDNSEHNTNALLSSLRNNLRKSCVTRPAARVVANDGRRSEGGKSSSGKSSVGSSLDQGSFGKKRFLGGVKNKLTILDGASVTGGSQFLRNKAKVSNVTKPSALSVWSFSNRQGNNIVSSKVTAKGKVQQHKSVGKVLMPHKVNEQHQTIDKGSEKVGVGKRTASLARIKETTSATMATYQKTKSSDKVAQSSGNIQKPSKLSVAQKNGSKKLIGVKEKTNNRSKDKDTLNPSRNVYFR